MQKLPSLHIPLSGTFELTPVCNMSMQNVLCRDDKIAARNNTSPCEQQQTGFIWEKPRKTEECFIFSSQAGSLFYVRTFRKFCPVFTRWDYLSRSILTGPLIDEKVVGWLKDTPPTRINITFNTAPPIKLMNAYAEILRDSHRSLKAIHLLKEAGIAIKINCSLTPYYTQLILNRYLNSAEKKIWSSRLPAICFPPLRRDASKIGQNDRFTPKEAAYYAAKIEAQLYGKELYLEKINNQMLEGLPYDTGEDCTGGEGEEIRCRAGKCSFWVTWDGKFLPCGMLPSNSAKMSLKLDLTKPGNRHPKCPASIRLPAKCSVCKLKDQCRSCAAMVYTESGNYHDVPLYRCEMAHCYSDACRQVAAEINQGGI